jgi:hypothetical protein
LALTSPTSGGRSAFIVRSQTKATEFSFRVKAGSSRTIRLHEIACVCVCATENVAKRLFVLHVQPSTTLNILSLPIAYIIRLWDFF